MRGRGRSLAKASTSIYGLKLGEAVVSTLLAATLARLLGAAGYGDYSLAIVVATLGVVLAQIGLPPLVIRETAAALTNNKGSAHAFWQWALRTAFGSAVGVSVILGIAFLIVDRYDLGDPSAALYGALALIPVLTAMQLHNARLRGRGHTVIAQAIRSIMRPTGLLTLAAGSWLIGATVLPGGAVLLNLVASLAALLCAVALVWRKESPRRANEISSRVGIREALPFAVTEGLQRFNAYADILLLGLLGTSEAVGTYRVATQLALIVSMVLDTIAFAAAPILASLYASGDFAKLQRLARRAAQAATLTAAAAFTGIGALGQIALAYAFGNEFVSAYAPLLILAAGHSLNAAFGLCAAVLNMTGFHRRVSLGLGAGTTVNVVLNAALIPTFGMMGAATATALSTLVWNIILWRATRRYLGINTACFGFSKAKTGR